MFEATRFMRFRKIDGQFVPLLISTSERKKKIVISKDELITMGLKYSDLINSYESFTKSMSPNLLYCIRRIIQKRFPLIKNITINENNIRFIPYSDEVHPVTVFLFPRFYTFFKPISHQPPAGIQANNANGFWAFKDCGLDLITDVFLDYTPMRTTYEQVYLNHSDVTAQVTCFGKIIEYENHYRSSSLRINHLTIHSKRGRKFVKANPSFLAQLEDRYQCDIDF